MIVILLPAYNEERSLLALLPKIQAAMEGMQQEYRVVVCDDGSTDQTSEVLRNQPPGLPLEIIRHKINRGLGETSRDLFERAAEICGPEDIIVRMDCDDTHDPDVIQALICKLNEGYHVAIASRFAPGGGQIGLNAYRTTLSASANIFMKIFFPIPGVRDYSNGFRAYRASIVQEAIRTFGNDFIQLKGLGFTGTLEKLVKLKLVGARIAEVPFVLRYDQKLSESKMVSSITTLGYMVMTVLYHWPWGGWRASFKKRKRQANGPET